MANVTELVPEDGSPRHLLKSVNKDAHNYVTLVTIAVAEDGEIFVGNSRCDQLELVGLCNLAANRFMRMMYEWE
jgi:hypothetical protein